MYGKILLVGTVSNVALSIEEELNVVLKALSIFNSVEVFLVESDSIDNTTEILGHIKKTNGTFNFVSKGMLSKKLPNRIERIAFCRNVYVEHIRENYETQGWNYVAVADLDEMNFKLTSKGVKSCFTNDLNWSGIMANQKNGYYDLYALRAENWVEEDIFKQLDRLKRNLSLPKRYKNSFFDFLSNFYRYDRLRQEVIYSKMINIKKNSAFINVFSAFGGFAIYKPEVFFNSDYSITPNSFESEHIAFHLNVGKIGGKFYINPKLINSSINEYNLNKYRIVRLARELKKYYRRKKH